MSHGRVNPGPRLGRHYAKLCDIEDFADPEFGQRAATIRPDLDLSWQLDRKTWEFTMLSLLLEDWGVLDGHSRVLSVGAGAEAIVFWLAPRVQRMVAVDRYGQGRWSSVHSTMLSDPAALSPYPEVTLDGLETCSMDARDLRFPDASFDAVFSLSSIEHFGSPSDIRRAAAEIGRVLAPTGVAYVVTELELRPPTRRRRALEAALSRFSGGRLGRPEVFSQETLDRDVITASGLTLLQPLSLEISTASFENLAVWRLGRRLRSSSGRYHPHIVLRGAGRTYTSVALPLWRRP
ncbi:MAG: class I SAM-dependent methyltransferase [Solirubrobacteraceae bacterium]